VTRESLANARVLGGMSRRDFLRIGGASLTGAALLGLVKCGTHSGTKTGVWRPLWFATAGGPRPRFVRTPGACAGPG